MLSNYFLHLNSVNIVSKSEDCMQLKGILIQVTPVDGEDAEDGEVQANHGTWNTADHASLKTVTCFNNTDVSYYCSSRFLKHVCLASLPLHMFLTPIMHYRHRSNIRGHKLIRTNKIYVVYIRHNITLYPRTIVNVCRSRINYSHNRAINGYL